MSADTKQNLPSWYTPGSESVTKLWVVVPVANGSEEIEAVTVIDTLRRAKANVIVASVETSKQVTMSRGVKVVADALIQECTEVCDGAVMCLCV
jgi:protein deglycase